MAFTSRARDRSYTYTSRAVPGGAQGLGHINMCRAWRGVRGWGWQVPRAGGVGGGGGGERPKLAVLGSSGAWQLWWGLYGTVRGGPRSTGPRVITPIHPPPNMSCISV